MIREPQSTCSRQDRTFELELAVAYGVYLLQLGFQFVLGLLQG